VDRDIQTAMRESVTISRRNHRCSDDIARRAMFAIAKDDLGETDPRVTRYRATLAEIL